MATAACEDGKECRPDAKADRVIVVAGKTGNGKSAMCNVAAGRYDGSLFPESNGPASHTQGITSHSVKVAYGGQDYVLKIVDTIGFADNRFSNEQVLRLQAELGNVCSEGIHQVLFVTKGRFTSEDKDSLNSLMDVVFQPDVAKFCTVIRTWTPASELADGSVTAKTDAYKQEVIRAHSRVNEISTFLMVSNPDDGSPASIQMRQRSRQKLMEHIILHYRSRYTPPTFATITARIDQRISSAKAKQDVAKKLTEQLKTKSEIDERQRRDAEARNKELAEKNAAVAKKVEAAKAQKKPPSRPVLAAASVPIVKKVPVVKKLKIKKLKF
eukprot:scpid80439/ scgid19985/ 